MEGFFLLTDSPWQTLEIKMSHRPFQELTHQIWTPQMIHVFGQKIPNWFISSSHLFELEKHLHPHLLQHILHYLPTKPTFLIWLPLDMGRNYLSWETAGTINLQSLDSLQIVLNQPISGKIWIQAQHRIFI
jgi:hypothetical protein